MSAVDWTEIKDRIQGRRDRSRRYRPKGVLELARERIQRSEERRLLGVVRAGRRTCASAEAEPLISVTIPTYNRGRVIVERAISSALGQSYDNIEVLVVGDACDEPTEAAVRGVDDPRVRFLNLPARGIYPDDPRQRWMVAGVAPMNMALQLARGAWIAPCDDDDELTLDHCEVLLEKVRADGAEFVFSKARMERRPDDWQEVGSLPLRSGSVSHGTVLYASGLRFLPYSNTCWKIGEPADWNRWKRMQAIGVHMTFLDRVTYTHFVESPNRTATASGVAQP